MDQLVLQPIKRIQGTVQLPGSKSLSNRILLLASMAHGVTDVYNLLDSDDTNHMLDALRRLGVRFELSPDKTRCRVHGLGGPFPPQETELFLGNAGTAIRPVVRRPLPRTGSVRPHGRAPDARTPHQGPGRRPCGSWVSASSMYNGTAIHHCESYPMASKAAKSPSAATYPAST